jgi:hypothetical protein
VQSDGLDSQATISFLSFSNPSVSPQTNEPNSHSAVSFSSGPHLSEVVQTDRPDSHSMVSFLSSPTKAVGPSRPRSSNAEEAPSVSETGNRSESASVGLIVGLVVGAVILAIVAISLLLMLRRRVAVWYSYTDDEESKPGEMTSSFVETNCFHVEYLNEVTMETPNLVDDSGIWLVDADERLDGQSGEQGIER